MVGSGEGGGRKTSARQFPFAKNRHQNSTGGHQRQGFLTTHEGAGGPKVAWGSGTGGQHADLGLSASDSRWDKRSGDSAEGQEEPSGVAQGAVQGTWVGSAWTQQLLRLCMAHRVAHGWAQQPTHDTHPARRAALKEREHRPRWLTSPGCSGRNRQSWWGPQA